MLWKCLGEKHILPNLTDLDELKLNEVKIIKNKIFNYMLLLFRLKNMQKNRFYLIFRGEPRSNAPVIRADIPETSVEQKIITKKTIEETIHSKPTVIEKKKSVVVVKSPTPTKEPRPLKPAQIPSVLSRIDPPRSKPTGSTALSSTGKSISSKIRPVTAPSSKSTSTSTTHQSRTQRLVPIIVPPPAKTRPKPPVFKAPTPSKTDLSRGLYESHEIFRICWDCDGKAMVKFSALYYEV